MHYIKQLTFLRFLAASLVIVFHFGDKTWPFNLSLFDGIVSNGSVAVSFFFFLSGVVLGINYLQDSTFKTKSFFIKRIARIYPVYLLAFVLTITLAMLLLKSFPRGLSIILQVLGLHAWLPGACLEINFTSWSLSVELFFYLIFPFALPFFKKLSDGKITFIVILIWVISIFQFILLRKFPFWFSPFSFNEFILYFPLWHLNTFLFGILCAKYILRSNIETKENFLRARFFYISGIFLFFLIFYTENEIKHLSHNGLLSPIFFLILSGLATDKSLLTRFLGNKSLILLGNASYCMYILQWPFLLTYFKILKTLNIEHAIATQRIDGYLFYIYFIALTIFSVLVYLFYEEKMKTIILNKWIKKETI